MANTHHLQVQEPVEVLRGLTLEDDPDFEGQSATAEVGDVEVVESIPERQYSVIVECTCGEEFGNDFEAAEQHLKNIRDSPNGEAVTSPE